MKRILGRTIVVAGVAILLAAVYFLFGTERYKSLTQEEAEKVMENSKCLILDVRTPAEYNSGHIPGAICIPVDQIRAGEIEEDLPDKQQVLSIYCYSGRRAVESAKLLASMGYTNAYEFGGIVDWTGEVVQD